MRKIIVTLSIIAALLFPVGALVGQAGAVDIFQNCNNPDSTSTPTVCTDVTTQQKSGTNPIIGLIKSIIEVLSIVVGVASVIGILISSIKMITAGGDSNAVASARSGVIFSLIGIMIVILAQTIVIFVLDKVT